MSAIATVSALSRAAKAPLLALAAFALLMAAPAPTLPGLAPPEAAKPSPAAVPDGLRELVASLSLRADPEADPNAEVDAEVAARNGVSLLRQPVTAFAVRLAVDRQARHRLDARLEVRPDHLGGPGRPLRQVCLNLPAPEPEAEAVPTPPLPSAVRQAALPADTRPTAPAKPVPAVKNPSPAVAGRPAAQPPASPGLGRSVLVAGDSLSLFLAEALKPLLAGRPGTTFAAKGKISSGLARPDFFDWEREMARQSALVRPDTVVIMIATNDNQTLTRPDGVKVAFGRPGWEAEYARRVRRLVELARGGNPAARVYWIGAPVMAEARLNADVAAINAVIARQIAALPGCRFVDVSRTLADRAGRYAASLPGPSGPRPIRTRDGVHLLPQGARLLADACLAAMSPAMAALSRP